MEVSPKDYYWGRSAYLRDPDGQLIEITHSSSLNGKELKGRTLTVNEARPRTDNRGGGRGRY
jgi:hypothetical protein